eukprot:169675-Hanusia_phi.AAC.2
MTPHRPFDTYSSRWMWSLTMCTWNLSRGGRSPGRGRTARARRGSPSGLPCQAVLAHRALGHEVLDRVVCHAPHPRPPGARLVKHRADCADPHARQREGSPQVEHLHDLGVPLVGVDAALEAILRLSPLTAGEGDQHPIPPYLHLHPPLHRVGAPRRAQA